MFVVGTKNVDEFFDASFVESKNRHVVVLRKFLVVLVDELANFFALNVERNDTIEKIVNVGFGG